MVFFAGETLSAQDLNELLLGMAPVGAVMMWTTASPPSGWLICDGSSFSAATYPTLNTVLGGTTLPDLRDRVPVGASGTKAVKSTGGADTVTIAAANLPPHAHTGPTHNHTNPTHTHAISTLLKTNNAGGVAADNGGDSVVQGTTTGRFNGGQTGATGSGDGFSTNGFTGAGAGTTGNGPGSSAALSVQNPYTALNFIIRAG